MKLCTHDVVRMASNNVDTSSTLIIPDSHGLVITGGEDPRELVMKEGGSDIINMSFQRKHTPFLFIIPNFDQSIVASGNEKRKLGVKIDSSRWSFVTLNIMSFTSNLATHSFML